MTRPTASNTSNNTSTAAADPFAGHPRPLMHIPRLLANMRHPPTDRALTYLFHGPGGTGKTATIVAMITMTGREHQSLEYGFISSYTQRYNNVILVGEGSEMYKSIGGRVRLNWLMTIPGLVIVMTSNAETPPVELAQLDRQVEVIRF